MLAMMGSMLILASPFPTEGTKHPDPMPIRLAHPFFCESHASKCTHSLPGTYPSPCDKLGKALGLHLLKQALPWQTSA